MTDFNSAVENNRVASSDTLIPCVVTFFNPGGADFEPFVNVIPSINRKVILGRVFEFDPREEIEEIPILYPSTQAFAVTIPLQAGDRGVLAGMNFNIDLWDIEGEPQADTYDSTFKDFNNSMFIPGGWPRPKGLDLYSADGLVLRTADNLTNITIKQGSVEINADEILINGKPLENINAPGGVPVGTSAAPEADVSRP